MTQDEIATLRILEQVMLNSEDNEKQWLVAAQELAAFCNTRGVVSHCFCDHQEQIEMAYAHQEQL